MHISHFAKKVIRTGCAIAVIISFGAGLVFGPVLSVSGAGSSKSGSTSGTVRSGGGAPPDMVSGDAKGGPGPGMGSGDAMGVPPQMPSGDAKGGPGPGMGSGDAMGVPPQMPGGDAKGGPGPGMGSGDAIGAPGGPGGGADTQKYDYTGSNSGELTADAGRVTSSGKTLTSTEADKNTALAVNGGTLVISGDSLKKSGDDTDGDSCNFYGLNSISLSVGEKSETRISDSELSASSQGSNGIFATDSATAWAENTSIETTADNSRGLDATYGGSIIADRLDISTQGDHSAALATDRGGGNISVTGSSLETAGSGSPLIYSTGNIQVDNVTGTSSGSQIAGMEGLNTIIIKDSELTSTATGRTASDPLADGVIIYQSTSGDSETTTGDRALFQAVDSTLKSSIESGTMFYVTNTSADVYLKNTDVDYDSDSADLLTVAGNDSNSWGTAGSNGGDVNFTADGETLKGDISVDSISKLNLYLLNRTSYTGSISLADNSAATDSTEDPVTVNIDKDSTWVVTADTEISNLNAEEGAQILDESGNTVTIIVNGKVKVHGDSDITLTVDGSFSTDVKTTSANEKNTDYIDRSDFDSYYGLSTAFDKTSSARENNSSNDASGSSHSPAVPAAAGAGILAVLLSVPSIMRHRKK